MQLSIIFLNLLFVVVNPLKFVVNGFFEALERKILRVAIERVYLYFAPKDEKDD